MKVLQTDKYFAMPLSEATPRISADVYMIPGAVLNRDAQEWRIPRTQVQAVRALMWRYQPVRDVPSLGWKGQPLYDYQIGALRFAQANPSILLDMYMATGKTRTAIEIMGMYDAQTVMVVGPVNSLPVWRDQLVQFARFDYSLLVLDNRDSVTVRADKLMAFLDSPVEHTRIILCNYEAVWRTPMDAAVMSQTWDMIICDEIHRLKSAGSKQSRFLARLAPRVPYRLGLSGTPTPHSILDIYGVYRFLQPSIFGKNFKKFKDTYTVTNPFTYAVEQYINMDTYRAKFNLIRYHVPRDMLKLDKPVFTVLPLPLTGKTWKTYKEVETEFYSELGAEQRIDAPNVLVKYLRLQQIESGFVGGEDGEIITEGLDNPKLNLIESFISDFPRDEKLVIFARFREEIRQIVAACGDMKRIAFQLTGEKKELDKWKKAPGAVLVVNLGAGSEAIDLTNASYAVFYSLSYKLGEYEQAVARLNRPGQRSAPHIYVIVPEGPNSEETVGRRVYGALRERRNLLNELVGGSPSGRI